MFANTFWVNYQFILIHVKKVLSIIIVLSFAFLEGNAQHDFWGGAQLDAAVPMGGQYDAGKSILKSKLAGQFNGHLLLQYRAFNRIGLELGLAQNYQSYHLQDRRFKSDHDDKYEGNIKFQNFYGSYHGAIQYFQPIPDSYVGVYVLGGYSWNFIGGGSNYKDVTFNPDGTTLAYTSTYAQGNKSVFFEAGVQIITDDEQNMITAGLCTNFGMGDMVNGNLVATQGGNVVHQDYFSSGGSYIGLVLKYHFRFAHIEKRGPRVKRDKEIKKAESVIVKQPDVLPAEQRKLVVSKVLKASSHKITITVVEMYREDNDIISLKLNDKWVLQNYTVVKKPYTIEAELMPGKNILVFHAENLGTMPPNTASVTIHDGTETYHAELRSTLDTSAVIEIDYTPAAVPKVIPKGKPSTVPKQKKVNKIK